MKPAAVIGLDMSEAKPQVKFRLPVTYKQDGALTVAICEPLDVVSQGKSRDAAHAAIIEAVSLFLETCYEMGTLHDVLLELGFAQLQPAEHHSRSRVQEMIEVPMELVANAKARSCRAQATR